MDAIRRLRVALAHDWLNGMRGGEKCLEVLCRWWPDADLYTLHHAPGKVSSAIENASIHPSFLQRLPGIQRSYRYLLPFMPAAIQQFRLTDCDLVLSLSHCVAKGIRPPLGVPHVCYCFTPMRYAWHMRHAYFPGRRLRTPAIRAVLALLRRWDRRTADRVTHFIAISKTIQQRILECYARESTVIYPPVDTEFFTPWRGRREDYYVVVSAFVPYKRIELAIEACNRLQRHLLVIGAGHQEARLKALAGPTVRFAGWQPNEVVREHMQRCRALLFPGEEDFGIVPVEANACGTPVIAFGKGGVTETILPLGENARPTGVWFKQQTVEDLTDAIIRLERNVGEFSPESCRRQAMQFTRRRFEAEMMDYLLHVTGTRQTMTLRAA